MKFAIEGGQSELFLHFLCPDGDNAVKWNFQFMGVLPMSNRIGWLSLLYASNTEVEARAVMSITYYGKTY